ncbi:class I SAM-dependent methyltransferase [Pseudonocardia acaciae]|uniref:class I SAM-dependent methyltransferase n=1 Tax=Pseudonocardia acaciae TaxID=551276 RepID=UPI00048D46A5|nr:class I SAM-dependent methyltransferase [Pseudonocardia acaciae]
MSFEVSADAYRRFMGRFSEPLAGEFVRLVDPARGQHVLDVGCGPGALTAVLADRLGPAAVAAADPSESFVAAVRERLPGVRAEQAPAERLPFADGSFDAAMAQLVVPFMSDPVAGLREMARVTRPGGTVAACVWDNTEGRSPLATFWHAALDLDPSARGESYEPSAGTREGHLAELFEAAGLERVVPTTISVRIRFESFDTWWEPFTLGVGPIGSYVAGLSPQRVDAVRERCRELLPAPPFDVLAMAWTVYATPA